MLVNTKSLILYYGPKFGLKYHKTNINKIYSFIYLELVWKIKFNNENMIKNQNNKF